MLKNILKKKDKFISVEHIYSASDEACETEEQNKDKKECTYHEYMRNYWGKKTRILFTFYKAECVRICDLT